MDGWMDGWMGWMDGMDGWDGWDISQTATTTRAPLAVLTSDLVIPPVTAPPGGTALIEGGTLT